MRVSESWKTGGNIKFHSHSLKNFVGLVVSDWKWNMSRICLLMLESLSLLKCLTINRVYILLISGYLLFVEFYKFYLPCLFWIHFHAGLAMNDKRKYFKVANGLPVCHFHCHWPSAPATATACGTSCHPRQPFHNCCPTVGRCGAVSAIVRQRQIGSLFLLLFLLFFRFCIFCSFCS